MSIRVPEIKLPTGWEWVKLADIARVSAGDSAPQGEKYFRDGEHHFIRMQDVGRYHLCPKLSETTDKVNDIAVKEKHLNLWPERTLLIPKSGASMFLNHRALTAMSAYVSSHLATVVAKQDSIPEFLYYWASILDVKNIAPNNSYPSLRIGELEEVELPLPPLPEQRKIAEVLGSVDGVIEGTRAVIEQLKMVKQAILEALLTCGLDASGHLRNPKTQPHLFKPSPLGLIPKEWRIVAVEDVCEKMFVGIAQAATHAYVETGGVPIIRTTNLRANYIDDAEMLQISKEFAGDMRSKTLQAGDVLTARTGYPGTSAVVPAQYDGAQCFTLLVSRPGPELSSDFLSNVMNSTIGERIVNQGQAGGAQQNLNVGVFSKAKIGLPPIEEQRAIMKIVAVQDELIRAETAKAEQIAKLKDALAQILLTGEKRVKV